MHYTRGSFVISKRRNSSLLSLSGDIKLVVKTAVRYIPRYSIGIWYPICTLNCTLTRWHRKHSHIKYLGFLVSRSVHQNVFFNAIFPKIVFIEVSFFQNSSKILRVYIGKTAVWKTDLAFLQLYVIVVVCPQWIDKF